MKKAMIVVNPSSGREQANDLVPRLLGIIREEYQSITINETSKAGDVKKFASQASEEEFDAIYLMGGDGTINEGVNGIAERDHRPIVGVVPLGTFNNLSSMLGFVNNYRAAVDQYQNVQVKNIDIGKLNDGYFISSVAAGILSASVKSVSPKEKTELGPIAYIKEALEALGDDRSNYFKIEIDDGQVIEELSLIMISVGNSLIRMQGLFPESTIDDGYLNFVGMEESNLGEKIGTITNVLSNGVENTEKLKYRQFKKCRIELLDQSPFDKCIVDGDEGPGFPLEIEVLPSHIRVFVPIDQNN